MSRSAHFWWTLLRHRPMTVARILPRRLREAAMPAPTGLATARFGTVRLELDMSLHVLMRKFYFRTHEIFLESVLSRFLRPGAIFIDVGANVGYWSAFAADRVGSEGEIHSFEPVPYNFARLRRLVELNPHRRIRANLAACGEQAGTMPMAVVPPTAENFGDFAKNTGSNSLLPGFLQYASGTERIEVAVTTLDDYVERSGIDLARVGLIKIDVEGFEYFCLKGMDRILSKPAPKVPILCEISTDPKLNPILEGRRIIEMLEGYGYRCRDTMTLRDIDRDHLAFEENLICT